MTTIRITRVEHARPPGDRPSSADEPPPGAGGPRRRKAASEGGPGAYGSGTEPLRLPIRELPMADKSPRHTLSKKSGKSLKEKRSERKEKQQSAAQMERLMHPREAPRR
jgi:hypothetical protein